MKVFNTLKRTKEEVTGGNLRMFVCGPTVYSHSHIGHARTYVVFDVLAKYLRKTGVQLTYLVNITDIDDKVIAAAKEAKKTPKAVALEFEKSFVEDMEALGVTSPDKYARATDYVPEIISQVQRLKEKEAAYEIEGAGVYYDISAFAEYGKLSGRTAEQAEDAVSRVDEAEGKRNKGDFALWKFAKPGEPTWESPWGDGRPGWHIEDTAITEKEFGSSYDLHGGARDLIFPHHEAEISQMEALSGKPLARYWLHSGLLRVEDTKMSKSLGNVLMIKDFLKDHPSRLLRYLVLKTHWRRELPYSDGLLEQAEKELERIDEFVLKAGEHVPEGKADDTKVREAMEDDLNTPLALTAVLELVHEGNTRLEKGETGQAAAILAVLKEWEEVFGVLLGEREHPPREVCQLVEKREEHRKKEEWDKADELRGRIAELGWEVEDTSAAPRLRRS